MKRQRLLTATIALVAFLVVPSIPAETVVDSLPWNLSEEKFTGLCNALAEKCVNGEADRLLDLLQVGRYEDGARSEVVGEAVGTVYDAWGERRFIDALGRYPAFAASLAASYLRVSHGNDTANAIPLQAMEAARPSP